MPLGLLVEVNELRDVAKGGLAPIGGPALLGVRVLFGAHEEGLTKGERSLRHRNATGVEALADHLTSAHEWGVMRKDEQKIQELQPVSAHLHVSNALDFLDVLVVLNANVLVEHYALREPNLLERHLPASEV